MVHSKEKSEFREKQRQFFDKLWKQLKNKKCQSCGKQIYGENKTIYWDHLLEKNKYPQLAFEEKNIIFVCGDCHAKKSMGWPTPKHKEAIEKAKKQLL